MNDLITSFERITGKKAIIENNPRHPADMLANSADISKAKELLNWEPQVALEEGIKNIVDWYLQERSWAQDIEL